MVNQEGSRSLSQLLGQASKTGGFPSICAADLSSMIRVNTEVLLFKR